MINQIIEEIIARLKKRFDTDNLWKSDDGETAYLAIGNLWEVLTEEMSTALLEVDQAGYARAMGEAREIVGRMQETNREKPKAVRVAEALGKDPATRGPIAQARRDGYHVALSDILSSLTPTDNNKEA